VTALKAELDAAGIRTPQRRHRSGRCSGGAAFSRGRLYDLLANPIFVGRIRHRDRVHPGQHAAIVDMGVWQAPPKALIRRGLSAALRGAARCV
jgi:site-specific DNA recombinase